MATEAEIAYVRRMASEPTETIFSDEMISAMIDADGTDATIASIWETKAASFVTSVDVTEAGASHKFSDVYKNAAAMAAYWRKKLADAVDDEEEAATGRVKVRKIVRS